MMSSRLAVLGLSISLWADAQMLSAIVGNKQQAGGGSPPALINHQTGCFDSTGGTTSSIDTTGANFIAIAFSGDSTITVTDNKSNSYTSLTTYHGAGPSMTIAYAQNATTGSGHTFTVAGTEIYSSVVVFAVSNIKTSGAFNAGTDSGANVAPATTIQPGSITPPSGYQFLVTGIGSSAVVATINSSFTTDSSYTNTGSPCYASQAAYLIQTTGAAVNPTWTLTGSALANAAIASFGAIP